MYKHVVASDAVIVVDRDELEYRLSLMGGMSTIDNLGGGRYTFSITAELSGKDDLLDFDTKMYGIAECLEDVAIVRSATWQGNDLLLRKTTYSESYEPMIEVL